jgi:hypothetical protein
MIIENGLLFKENNKNGPLATIEAARIRTALFLPNF